MPIVKTPSVRLGYRVADPVVEREIANRTLDDRDYDLVLNPAGGPLMVYMPDTRPLCCYLPGVLRGVMEEVDAYRILHPLHVMMTNNRGMASGTRRIERGAGGGTRSDSMSISSVMIGASDPGSVYRYCRMTEWTGSHLPEWESLAPMFRVIARYLEERVTERYNIQMDYVRKTDPGWVVPGTPFTSITVNNCVDPETECLTRRLGWTRYDQLNRDDEILAYDPDTDTTRWEPLRDLFVNPDYKGDMIRLSSRSFTALTTPDHRWPLRGRSTRSSWKVFTSESLPKSYWSLVRSAPHEAPVESRFSDDFVKLAAWYFTEGTLLPSGGSVSICQSDLHNPQHVDEIRRVLKALGAITLQEWRSRPCSESGCHHKAVSRGRCGTHYSRYRAAAIEAGTWAPGSPQDKGSRRDILVCNEYTDGDKVTWVLTGMPVTDLVTAVHGARKIPTMEFLANMTQEQLRLFTDTCIKGDGSAERRAFWQYDEARMNAFTVAAVLSGESPAISQNGNYCMLWSSRLTYCDDNVTRIAIPYEGTVWCPSVPSGHWVARRNGKVILSGNSYPTGVHRDAGDLETGFSTLACIRRGDYEGGKLVFPQYRIAADMQDGDLLLMDAHQWHGNTRITCGCGERMINKFCSFCGAERISIVSYYRTKMADCGSPEDEYERAVENTEKRSQPRKTESELTAVPAAEVTQPESPVVQAVIAVAGETPAPVISDVTEVKPRRRTKKASIATGEPEAAPEPESHHEPVKKPRARVTRKPKETPAAEPETEAPAAKPRRASRSRKAQPEPVKIAVNPETGEPLEG